MNEDIRNYISSFDLKTMQRFDELYDLIEQCAPNGSYEKLWAKIPSFYYKEQFIRLIPFKDHINIEAIAVLSFKDQLLGYNITPKGMLQIYHSEPIPYEVLKKIFTESFNS
ncbi:DUF1801 domain-containing protein [Lachnoclostridium phytofermentans]|uniref:DUF1801 domain-containing protein n=1 Tax=Lachnoclostridium phytofermentans (strain ATCC 700394 / DSM 18823 / ISDg) TaxID=357809 RepID=A9KRT1_LACP7|nr:DUF1801 domain-containing protein [Lachnoclostridium phytofermentans]ABX43575.1 Domain of unknown function DUF1801 [Lachnoclostridium phytofermentans ISDg]